MGNLQFDELCAGTWRVPAHNFYSVSCAYKPIIALCNIAKAVETVEVITTKIAINKQAKLQGSFFADIGMDISTAVTIFSRKTIRENGFPLVIIKNVPNAETIAAMKEYDEMLAQAERYKSFATAEDIFAEQSG